MRSFYRFAFVIVWPIMAVLYPIRRRDPARLPDGPAIVCANHSSYMDPVLLALAVGRRYWLHFMAKAELGVNRPFRSLLEKLGAFFVERGASDLGAIRTSMKLLKSGEKVAIFPEGTRVSQGDSVAAKAGAIRLAMRLGAPIVPAYVGREKKLFHPVDVVVGEPYLVPADADMQEAADELLQRIYELQPTRKRR